MTTLPLKLALGTGFFGALGVLARFFLVPIFVRHFPNFPMGTFVINLLGSFAIGIAFVCIREKGFLTEQFQFYLMTGFLGGFTTFSSFSLELLQLFQSGRVFQCVAYGLSSPILGFLAAYLGILVGKQF